MRNNHTSRHRSTPIKQHSVAYVLCTYCSDAASLSITVRLLSPSHDSRMDNPAVTAPAVSRIRSGQRSAEQIVKVASDPAATDTAYVRRAPDIDGKFDDKNEYGWRRIVRNFSPSWFSVTMGTGIVSTILFAIPWKAKWLYYLSIIVFVLNVALFVSALTISILRYAIWPEIWQVLLPIYQEVHRLMLRFNTGPS